MRPGTTSAGRLVLGLCCLLAVRPADAQVSLYVGLIEGLRRSLAHEWQTEVGSSARLELGYDNLLQERRKERSSQLGLGLSAVALTLAPSSWKRDRLRLRVGRVSHRIELESPGLTLQGASTGAEIGWTTVSRLAEISFDARTTKGDWEGDVPALSGMFGFSPGNPGLKSRETGQMIAVRAKVRLSAATDIEMGGRLQRDQMGLTLLGQSGALSIPIRSVGYAMSLDASHQLPGGIRLALHGEVARSSGDDVATRDGARVIGTTSFRQTWGDLRASIERLSVGGRGWRVWAGPSFYRWSLSTRFPDAADLDISAPPGSRATAFTELSHNRFEIGVEARQRARGGGVWRYGLAAMRAPTSIHSDVRISQFLNSIGSSAESDWRGLSILELGVGYESMSKGAAWGCDINQLVPLLSIKGAGGGGSGTRKTSGGTRLSAWVAFPL